VQAFLSEPPSGYLDTNLIIGLAQDDLPRPEMAATRELLRRQKSGTVALYTSHVAKEELQRKAIPGRLEDLIYLLIENVPAMREEHILPPAFGPKTTGEQYAAGFVRIRDRALESLEMILPDADDARHVFQAAANRTDYFITCDEKTILRHTAAIEAATSIRPRLPSQVVAELDAR